MVGVLAVILRSRDSVKYQDSVEYHVREYRKLSGRETLLDEIGDTFRKTLRAGKGGRRGRMREHKAALIRLGYLEERTFMVTNGAPENFAAAMQRVIIKKGTNWEFFTAVIPRNTNVVNVVGVKDMIPTWEEVLIEMRQTKRSKTD